MSKIYMFLLLFLAWCSAASAHVASARLAPGQVLQTTRQVSGRITDDSGTGLPGVNILIEGTTLGTVTDADGKFNLEVPSDESALVISFIGYATQKITVGSQSIIDVTLVPDVTSLDEVVVTGYSTQRR